MEQDFKGSQIETKIETPKAKKWVELSDYKIDEKNTFGMYWLEDVYDRLLLQACLAGETEIRKR